MLHFSAWSFTWSMYIVWDVWPVFWRHITLVCIFVVSVCVCVLLKKYLYFSIPLMFVILNFSVACSFALQTNEVTNRIQCHRSRWWTRHRAAASASWKHPTLPTSSSRMWGRVSCPRHPWSVATPWPLTSLPTPKTGWASSRYITHTPQLLQRHRPAWSIKDQTFTNLNHVYYKQVIIN